MFKSDYEKNIKIMSCYLKFHFKQWLCGEEHQYTTKPFLFFLKKSKPKRQKKVINISYLLIVLTKMTPSWFQVDMDKLVNKE